MERPAPMASDPLQELQALRERVGALEARVERLEGRESVPRSGPIPPDALPQPGAPALRPLAAVLGRLVLALAGAFLIRAFTEAGLLPRLPGVILGLAYAAAWSLAAEWAGRRGDRLAAGGHALAGALIALPLFFEATVRFGVLSPGAAVLGLLLVPGLLLWVAGHQSLEGVGWLTALGLVGTLLALLRSTCALGPVGLGALGMGLGALLFRDRIGSFRWALVLGAQLLVGIVALLAGWPGGPPEGWATLSPGWAFLLATGLAGLGLGSVLRPPAVWTVGEAAQALLGLTVGFAALLHLAPAAGIAPAWIAGAAAVLGLGLGGSLIGKGPTRPERRFRGALALALLGGAAGLALPAQASALAWLGLGALLAVTGFPPEVALAGAACFLGAGALRAGLLPAAWDAWAGPGASPGSGALLGLAVLGLLGGQAHLERRGASGLARILAALGLLGLLSLILRGLPEGLRRDPGALAALRTGLLCLAALGLASGSRRKPFAAYRGFVYPLLALACLKVLAEDLPRGRPLTIFLGLALLGAGLLICPRLLREGADGSQPPSGPTR